MKSPIFPGLLHPAGNFDGTSVTGETGSTGSTPKARSTDSVGTGVGSTTRWAGAEAWVHGAREARANHRKTNGDFSAKNKRIS